MKEKQEGKETDTLKTIEVSPKMNDLDDDADHSSSDIETDEKKNLVENEDAIEIYGGFNDEEKDEEDQDKLPNMSEDVLTYQQVAELPRW